MAKPVLHHYWQSSASWRVRWALAIKGIAFDSVTVDLASGAQRRPEHLARNPMGRVPALMIDGHCLAESVAIIEYLEETRPTPTLYPKDALARARVRQVVETVNAAIQPFQNLAAFERAGADKATQKHYGHHFNEMGLGVLEALLGEITRELGNGRFAVGDTLTAADLYLVPQVQGARRFGVDVQRFPTVLAAEAAAMATEHAHAARPENQPDAPKAGG
jgi:maleylacetoacetate isomerase